MKTVNPFLHYPYKIRTKIKQFFVGGFSGTTLFYRKAALLYNRFTVGKHKKTADAYRRFCVSDFSD